MSLGVVNQHQPTTIKQRPESCDVKVARKDDGTILEVEHAPSI